MKICIPTKDDRGFEAQVSDHFGGAPFFAMVDTDDGLIEVVPNPGCHEHPHSCHHVGQLGVHGVQAVVCRGLGKKALAALRAAGVDVLVPADGSVSDILAAVRAGNVHPMRSDAACGGGRGREGGGGCHGGGGHHERRRRRQRQRGRGSRQTSR